MADDSRPPNFCPWDPGQACKTGNGACLPPRKRLLAGLKQNGWLSSSFPYAAAWQSCIGAPCAGLMEELKLEVDLEGAKMDSNGDNCLAKSTIIQGESNGGESSDSGKSKRAFKRKKCLSLLADRHSYAKKSQPDDPKSRLGSKLQKKSRGNMSSIIASKVTRGEKETVSSHREMVDAAKATAAFAARTAAEAKAIAADKAAAAAKAAAVAKAALEAIAIAACEEVWEPQPKSTWRHVHATKKQKRKGNELKQEVQPKTRLSPLPPHVGDGVLVSPEKEKSKEDELKPVVQISTVASPLPPPVDDEELARQLHRAMNSSPRISRNLAPLECLKKDETSPPSTQSRFRGKCQRARGCGPSMEKKEAKKKKLKVSRTSSARADVKVKSMSVINETLNLLQGAGPSQHRVLDGMVSCCAASHDPGDNKPLKKGTAGPLSAKHRITPLTKYIEEDHRLPSNHDGDSRKSNLASKSGSVYSKNQNHEDGALKAMGVGEELSVIKSAVMIKEVKLSGARIANKKKSGKSLLTACADRMQVLPHIRDINGVNKVYTIRIEHRLAKSLNAAAELTGLHLETVVCDKQVDTDENEAKVNALSLGSDTQVTEEGIKESSVKEVQKSTCLDGSSKANSKNFPLSTHGERQTRHQKILRGLSNGLPTGNQTFGGSMSLTSYMPSPTVS